LDEVTWLENYNKILFDYQQSFEGNDVNLLNSIDPPKATLIQVSLFICKKVNIPF
jgi:hypothetical protein